MSRRFLEEDLDAGYCPFCGVFVDGQLEEHWCPEWEENEEWEEDEEEVEYDDD